MPKHFLFYSFLFILGLKILLAFLMNGPFIFPDEACIVSLAKNFASSGSLSSCGEIIKTTGGDPFPLFSIIISPFYLFLSSEQAYYAILLLHSVLISSLIFPLFKIISKFKIQKKEALLLSALILFLPHILAFEKVLMTEASFIFVNIWLLYFYIESFNKNKLRNKLITFFLSILAVFIRPFGFIVPISIIANEIFNSKNKKRAILLSMLIISIIGLAIFFFRPTILDGFISKLQTVTNTDNLGHLLESFKNQINSFVIGAFFLPLVFFVKSLISKQSEDFRKIKIFLLSFISLSFLISWQHQYGYLLQDNSLDLLTRYINVPIILIILFGLISIVKTKNFKFTNSFFYISALLILPLFFTTDDTISGTLNLEFSHIVQIESFITLYLIPIIIILFLLLSFQKLKLALVGLISILLVNSAASYIQLQDLSHINLPPFSSLTDHFKKFEDKKIMFLQRHSKLRAGPAFWGISTLTDNNINLVYFEVNKKHPGSIVYFDELITFAAKNTSQTNIDLVEYDYLISYLNLPLPLELIGHNGQKVYKIIKKIENTDKG